MAVPLSPVGLNFPKLTSAGGIRLLELYPAEQRDAPVHAAYQAVDLKSVDRHYETLSYTWRDGDATEQKIIYIDTTPVYVSPNLFSAIQTLRLPSTTRHLWIDALCINQMDLSEKTQQVNMMSKIYSQCFSCNIWLGDLGSVDRSDAQDALDIITGYTGQGPGHETARAWLADQARRERARNHINHIVSLPWWFRVWTVQEAVLPKQATMHWGPCQISWAIMARAAINMVNHAAPSWMYEHHSDVSMNPFTGYVIGMLKARHDNHCGLLVRWRHRQATNPLDKVYALLGFRDDLLRELSSVSSCDYTVEPRTLFARVSADIIHAYGTLEPVIGNRGELRVTEGLPSWAMDYAGAMPGTPVRYSFWEHDGTWIHRGYTAGTGIPGPAPVVQDHRVLCQTGIFVDTVANVEKRMAEEGSGKDSFREIVSSRVESGRRLIQDWVSTRSKEADPKDYSKTTVDLGKVLTGELVPETTHGSDWPMQHTWVTQMLSQQALFITQKGLVGIGPVNAEPGQEVWVLSRSKFPFILAPSAKPDPVVSPSNHEEYTLVADCFVRGIMMGEAVTTDSIAEKRDLRIV
ncbi:unnamed protein product [Discula destructiva]